MSKELWKPGTMIYPVPVVLVTCGTKTGKQNIITVAWTGTINTNPPMCYISVRPERFSHDIIRDTQEYVINLTTKDLVVAVDWCGVRSGRDYDKFKEMNLTPVKASIVSAPLLEESPINIECIVKEIKPLGTHNMFISEVVAIHADRKYLDHQTGGFDLVKAQPICYLHGKYFLLGRQIGKFGFSVQKRKNKRLKFGK